MGQFLSTHSGYYFEDFRGGVGPGEDEFRVVIDSVRDGEPSFEGIGKTWVEAVTRALFQKRKSVKIV